jgi:hypothetical protein
MKEALELNGRERGGTERNAYEDIMEALDEGKQGPVLRQQREIVEQCAPDNVLADVVMEMECSLGSLRISASQLMEYESLKVTGPSRGSQIC